MTAFCVPPKQLLICFISVPQRLFVIIQRVANKVNFLEAPKFHALDDSQCNGACAWKWEPINSGADARKCNALKSMFLR